MTNKLASKSKYIYTILDCHLFGRKYNCTNGHFGSWTFVKSQRTARRRRFTRKFIQQGFKAISCQKILNIVDFDSKFYFNKNLIPSGFCLELSLEDADFMLNKAKPLNIKKDCLITGVKLTV